MKYLDVLPHNVKKKSSTTYFVLMPKLHVYCSVLASASDNPPASADSGGPARSPSSANGARSLSSASAWHC